LATLGVCSSKALGEIAIRREFEFIAYVMYVIKLKMA
jgi:hypothetical protein